MAAPTLNAYEYQYKDTGVKLNADSPTIPFWDVEAVEGLDSLAPVQLDAQDIDGGHGSYVNAKYVSGLTIILNGTLYATPTTFNATLETLRSTLVPDNVNYPFYFKHPGLAQRYVLCKPAAFKIDVTSGRRQGAGAFMLQLAAGDPRQYVDNTTLTMTSGAAQNVSNSGNTESFPVVTLVGAFTNVTLNIAGVSIVFASVGALAGQTTIIDTSKRQVTVAGIDKTGTYSSGTWPTLIPGASRSVTVTVTGGSPTISFASKSAWL